MRKILTMLIIVAGAIFTLSCLNPLMPEGGGTGGTSIIDGHDIELVSVQASIPNSYDETTEPMSVNFRVKNIGTNMMYSGDWPVLVYFKTADELPIESRADLDDMGGGDGDNQIFAPGLDIFGGPPRPIPLMYLYFIEVAGIEAGEFKDLSFDLDCSSIGSSNVTYHLYLAFVTPAQEETDENNYGYMDTTLCKITEISR